MKERILVEMHINEKEQQLFTDFILKNKIKHNIYTFEIGNIGTLED